MRKVVFRGDVAARGCVNRPVMRIFMRAGVASRPNYA